MNPKLKKLGYVVFLLWITAAIQGYIYIWMPTARQETSWYDGSLYTYYENNGSVLSSAILTTIIAIVATIFWAVIVDDSHYTDQEDENVIEDKSSMERKE